MMNMRNGINPVMLGMLGFIMSQPNPGAKKSRLGARIIRGFFLGLGIGFVAFFAIYFMGISVNLQSTSGGGGVVLNPIALGLMAVGFILFITLGLEYSEYLEETA